MFYNPSVTIEDITDDGAASDRVLYIKPDLARDQYYNRVQERLNTMLQLALNEMQRAAAVRFNPKPEV